ncbi:MAG: O-acetyl-ADP-ribose deacetylase [Nitrospira sp.]|nr:O-acetyl-ADP-ribose deacetylase [Nitrospira sp.]
MEVKINKSILSLVEGDLTEQETDAIVNAANRTLMGGGGVDGAIHRAGGKKILEECMAIGGCETGQAVITSGGDLRAKHVIHTVGPVYRDGNHGEPEHLENAYRNSLELAASHGLKSIACPSISTGAYRYPLEEAAEIALKTAIKHLKQDAGIELVRFVLYGNDILGVYERVLKKLMPDQTS